MNEKIIRVFISYSWETEDHKSWVRKLADQLTHAGLNVRLDQWHVGPGKSLTQFMEEELRAADFSIVVCTPEYTRKSDARKGGVGYEQQIISGDLLSGIERSKFIPILRAGEFAPGPNHAIPAHFSGIATIDFRKDEAFKESLEKLLRVIYGVPKFTPPERGQVIPFRTEPPSSPIFTDQATHPKLLAYIMDWSSLDTLQFTSAVFDLAESSGINANLQLEVSAPDLDKLISCIKSQSKHGKDQQIVLEQREAIHNAKRRLAAAEMTGANLLNNMYIHYGPRIAISSTSRYLNIVMAVTVYRLARYQVEDGSEIFHDFINWFKEPHLSQVVQYIYSISAVVEVIIALQEYPEKNDKYTKVFVPLGSLENDGTGDFISFIWETCEYIPDNIWFDYVIPQMAFERSEDHTNFTVWKRDSCVYCTEGNYWRGSKSFVPGDSERIGKLLNAIVPRE